MHRYYRVRKAFAALVCALALTAGCSFKSKDVTAPSWTGRDLPNVSVNAVVSTTFSEAVTIDPDASTVTTSPDGRTTITRTGSFSVSGNTVSFTPDRPFNYGTTYTMVLRRIADSSGNSMADVGLNFTTTSSAPSTYHGTPVATLDDDGTYNSIALSPDGTTYVSYFNRTDRSLNIIATTDSGTFQGPFRIDGPSGAEKVGEFSSLAADSTGVLHIAYYHEGIGLKYAAAADISGAWSVETVDNGGGSAVVGKYASIALDRSDGVHISYYDETNTAVKYATNIRGLWARSTVDSGMPGENPGLYSSIKVDAGDVVHIAYYDAAPNMNLKYVNSTDWSPTAIDSTNQAGEFASLQLDAGGNVYIFYNYVAGDVRLIRCITNASGVWKHIDITSIVDSAGANITANPAVVDTRGIWHLSYYSGGILYYRSGVLFDAASNGWDWSPAIVVDNEGIGSGIYTSIAANSNGKARISYYDAVSRDLKLAF